MLPFSDNSPLTTNKQTVRHCLFVLLFFSPKGKGVATYSTVLTVETAFHSRNNLSCIGRQTQLSKPKSIQIDPAIVEHTQTAFNTRCNTHKLLSTPGAAYRWPNRSIKHNQLLSKWRTRTQSQSRFTGTARLTLRSTIRGLQNRPCGGGGGGGGFVLACEDCGRQSFIPHLSLFSFFFGFVLFWKWRSARAHRFHFFFFLGQDQSTVAPLLKPGSVPSGTVAECSLTSCV